MYLNAREWTHKCSSILLHCSEVFRSWSTRRMFHKFFEDKSWNPLREGYLKPEREWFGVSNKLQTNWRELLTFSLFTGCSKHKRCVRERDTDGFRKNDKGLLENTMVPLARSTVHIWPVSQQQETDYTPHSLYWCPSGASLLETLSRFH